MNTTVDRTVRLAVICSVAALFLGIVNTMTSPKIEQHKIEKIKSALADLVVSGEVGARQSLDNVIVFERYPIEEAEKLSGYILGLKANGYGGEMSLLASYSLNGALQKAILMDNSETPGLGKKAEKSEYMEKFLGKGNKDNPIPTTKGELEEPDAVGGSTITFSGVSKSLAAGAEYMREEIK